MGCYIWYSKEGPRRAAASPSPILAVPNVTAHPSTPSVPTLYYSMWHYNYPVPVKGLSPAARRASGGVMRWPCPSVCLFVRLPSETHVHKNAFLKKLSNLQLWSLLTTNRGAFQRTDSWTPDLERPYQTSRVPTANHVNNFTPPVKFMLAAGA